MSPIIGIAPCRSLPDYLESVRRAGGEPRVFDPLQERPDRVVGEVHGLLMTGGSTSTRIGMARRATRR